MEIDSFLDLVRRRRSIRRFKPDPVPDEYIEKIIEAGRWAMSGGNAQPWEFVVVKDKEKKDKLVELHGEYRKRIYELEMTRIERLQQPAVRTFIPPPFKDVPVIIAICGDWRTLQASVVAAFAIEEPIVFHQNLAAATMLMQLAAASLGLGAEWASVCEIHEPSYRAILGIPEVFRLEILMPVGYPAFQPESAYRREFSEIVHHDSYDMSKYRSDRDIIEWIAQLRERMQAHYPKYQ